MCEALRYNCVSGLLPSFARGPLLHLMGYDLHLGVKPMPRVSFTPNTSMPAQPAHTHPFPSLRATRVLAVVCLPKPRKSSSSAPLPRTRLARHSSKKSGTSLISEPRIRYVGLPTIVSECGRGSPISEPDDKIFWPGAALMASLPWMGTRSCVNRFPRLLTCSMLFRRSAAVSGSSETQRFGTRQ
jgi:hypothetical protein